MMRWWPICRREIGAALRSPSLCIFAALFFILTGVFFDQALGIFTRASRGDTVATAQMNDAPLNANDFLANEFFGLIFILLVFAIPFLTMRLISEERKLGTFDLLQSYPLRESDIVIGKFVATWLAVIGLLALSVVYPIIIWWASRGRLEIPPVLAAYLGLVLVSGAFVAIGLFASCLTENQLVAGLLSLGILLIGILLGGLAPPESGFLTNILEGIDLFRHADSFMSGVIRIGDVSHFVIIIIGALFLSERALVFRRLGVVR